MSVNSAVGTSPVSSGLSGSRRVLRALLPALSLSLIVIAIA